MCITLAVSLVISLTSCIGRDENNVINSNALNADVGNTANAFLENFVDFNFEECCEYIELSNKEALELKNPDLFNKLKNVDKSVKLINDA